MSNTIVDFELDEVTGNLIFPLRLISGPRKIAQSVRIQLRTWLGEWFLDLDHGVPYLTGVLGRQRVEMVEQVLRQQVLSVNGVRRITRFALDMDVAARHAAVRFAAEVDGGETIEEEIPIRLRGVLNV